MKITIYLTDEVFNRAKELDIDLNYNAACGIIDEIIKIEKERGLHIDCKIERL